MNIKYSPKKVEIRLNKGEIETLVRGKEPVVSQGLSAGDTRILVIMRETEVSGKGNLREKDIVGLRMLIHDNVLKNRDMMTEKEAEEDDAKKAEMPSITDGDI